MKFEPGDLIIDPNRVEQFPSYIYSLYINEKNIIHIYNDGRTYVGRRWPTLVYTYHSKGFQP
jgi:hypothetical protein